MTCPPPLLHLCAAAMKLTKGFPQFRRQYELAEGDAVRFVLEPVAGSHALPAIRILLLSRGNVNLAAAKRRRSLERKAGSPAALAAVGKRKHAKQESRDPGQHSLEAQGDHEHAAAATECKPLAAPTDEQPSLRNSSPDGGERQQPRPAKRPRAAAAAAAAAVAEQLCDSSDTNDEDSGSVGGNECSRQLWERQGGQQAPLAAAAAFSLKDVLHATVLLVSLAESLIMLQQVGGQVRMHLLLLLLLHLMAQSALPAAEGRAACPTHHCSPWRCCSRSPSFPTLPAPVRLGWRRM